MSSELTRVSIPYGQGHLEFELDSACSRLIGMYGVVVPREGLPDTDAAVATALAAPVGSPRLCEVARGARNVVII